MKQGCNRGKMVKKVEKNFVRTRDCEPMWEYHAGPEMKRDQQSPTMRAGAGSRQLTNSVLYTVFKTCRHRFVHALTQTESWAHHGEEQGLAETKRRVASKINAHEYRLRPQTGRDRFSRQSPSRVPNCYLHQLHKQNSIAPRARRHATRWLNDVHVSQRREHDVYASTNTHRSEQGSLRVRALIRTRGVHVKKVKKVQKVKKVKKGKKR